MEEVRETGESVCLPERLQLGRQGRHTKVNSNLGRASVSAESLLELDITEQHPHVRGSVC